MPWGAWGEKCLHGQKALPREDHRRSGRKASRDREPLQQKVREEDKKTCKCPPPALEHPKVNAMMRKPLIQMLEEKSPGQHEAFGDILVTQKRSVIRFDKYYYIYYQSFGPLSGLSEILFFTWRMGRGCRKIPPPLCCGLS